MPRFAEFFAGIGLVRMGLESAGWTCVFANDIDPKKYEMYSDQFGDSSEHFFLGDVRHVEAASLPSVDLATASFPCTDLSLAGSRRGLAGEHSSALWPFLEILQKLQLLKPKMILLENVTGFLTSHNGADLRSALSALNNLNYSVDMFILDAARFTPQSRSRLFIVAKQFERTRGVIRETRSPHLPLFEPLDSSPTLRPTAIQNFIIENLDLIWDIEKLAEPPVRTQQLEDIIEMLPDSAPEWWSDDRVSYLISQMSEKHLQTALSMKAANHYQYGTVFRRIRAGKSMAELRFDGIAGCLRTPKGGSGRQILLRAGRNKFDARLLTPRECARLMGADHFSIKVGVNQALFGFGDAVCVPAIKWIAENYLNKELQRINAGALS